jgi:uncharacterized protein (TIGR03083 family)
MDHLEHCAALDVEAERFAALLESAPAQAPVPTCPEWTVLELAAHLGDVHRWAERLVHDRAQKYQSSDDMDLDRGPADPTWMRAGARTLLDTLRSGDPDTAMWAWGADQHLRFWSRRQLHETLVHRVDLELAVGRTPSAEAEVAADAIDELLVNLKRAQVFSPSVAELVGDGRVLSVTTTDVAATWSIRLVPEGFVILDESLASDAHLQGDALEVLLVLYRRRPLAQSAVRSDGDRALIDFWLEHSALG